VAEQKCSMLASIGRCSHYSDALQFTRPIQFCDDRSCRNEMAALHFENRWNIWCFGYSTSTDHRFLIITGTVMDANPIRLHDICSVR
jgi:hypothetical protein